MVNKINGWNMNVSIDFCELGGHAIFKRADGKTLELMLSPETVAYLGSILNVSIDHSCILLGDTADFFNVPNNDKAN